MIYIIKRYGWVITNLVVVKMIQSKNVFRVSGDKSDVVGTQIKTLSDIQNNEDELKQQIQKAGIFKRNTRFQRNRFCYLEVF